MDTYIAFMDRYPSRAVHRPRNGRLLIGLVGVVASMMTSVVGPSLTFAGSDATAAGPQSASIAPDGARRS